jgi:adenylate cyclase
MLHIIVRHNGNELYLEHNGGPLEFGRGPARDVRRVQLTDGSVSRDQLWLEEEGSGRVRLRNLSQRRRVLLGDGTALAPGASCTATLPLGLAVGGTQISVERPLRESLASLDLQTLTPQAVCHEEDPPSLLLGDLGEAPSSQQLAQWLERVIALQRAGGAGADFYPAISRALVELIGLDLGMVVLRSGEGWEVAAGHAAHPDIPVQFSRTLINHACRERRTFYQDVRTLESSASLLAVTAAVASPIVGLHEDVAAVLYGARTRLDHGPMRIRPLEAQIVQLLAASVGESLIRSAALRTRVQFEQFFSPELVRELERDPGLLEGRDQEVTILMTDLRGSTSLSERLKPDATCRLIRDLMERLSECVVRQGGVIVDYAGDGLLAMWNAPLAQPDHPARACRAALAMQAAMPDFNARWQEVVQAPLQLGVGLNTGQAMVGNTGSSRKFKYGPLGHTVNVASRVESATKQLRLPILVAGTTRQLVGDQFSFRPVGPVRLAGLQEEVELHELLPVGALSQG